MRRIITVLCMLVGTINAMGQSAWPLPFRDETKKVESIALYLAADTHTQFIMVQGVADKVGFQLKQMLRKCGYPESIEGWNKLKKDLCYINEQTPQFAETFKSFLSPTQKKENGGTVASFFTETHGEYWFVYRPAAKGKLKKVIVTEGSAEFNSTSSFVAEKNTGQYNVRRKGAKGFDEKIKVTSQQGAVITMVWKGGDRNSIYLPAFKNEKPWIKSFSANATRMIELQRIDLNWQVLGAKNISIDNGLGTFPPKWQVGVSPPEDTHYVLTATNEWGTTTDTLSIKVERQKLIKVEMSFVTPPQPDSKEAGCAVVVDFYDINKRKICSFDGLNNQVVSELNKYDGPFEVEILEDTYSLDLVRGEIHIQLRPQSSDAAYCWKFSPIFILTFNDGTTRELYGFGWKEINSKDKTLEVIKF